ncbi:PREDICTED: protein Lines homolog isoform X2 [Pseudopodoces humilis]|uniref:protein Lines homolog isoform X2 n=1 Tax=Pseudopodoces humilis TaxID=181119 RepID=UPI0006B75E92|nr:PREDICTED: protein Lines homolog isoform X2 [Pseudopodoces humilis]
MMKISLLQQMYKDVLAGIPLAKESHHYSSLINLCVEQPPGDECCHQKPLPSTAGGVGSHQDTDISDIVPAADDLSNSFANMSSSFCPREVMLLQLTLIKMMVAKAESQEIEPHTRQKYCEIFVLLLKEAKIDSKLIHLLGCDDRLLSHMASQSLGSLVYLQLKEEDALNVPWLSFCLNTLLGFPGSARVADCLRTLAAILKETLKDALVPGAGVLKKLLAPLDAVLEGFYNAILLHHFDSHHYTSPYSEATNNLISFIDLLEALLASRIELDLPLRCQRILFLKVSYVLNVISSSIPYVIKKKFILLLKKCILYKSREDAKSGSLFLQAPSLCEDMLALSNAVLQVVNLTWLNQIPLSGKSSYFGSSEAAPGHDSQGSSDQTVLRALSLVLLKALEFKIHNSATEAEIKGDFESSMSQLLVFWRSHVKPSPQSHPVVHHCEWLSLVFMEQDDDMWEAAKALLLIYLKFDRLRCDAADNPSQKEEESWKFLVHAAQQGDNEAAEWNQSDSLTTTDSTSLLGSLQSLVNYDSSEDSEVESDGKECLVNTKQLPSNNEGEVRRRETRCSCRDDDQNPRTSEVSHLKLKGCRTSSCRTCMASSDNIAPLRVMLCKSTKCLEELQEAISRLQRRNLFPYNPSALLKLLSHVEKMSKSVNLQ